jgi:MurNAc alpha-1-phosphate uridylyltransferase
MIDILMIFAAGLGKRLRPITENLPKPLVRIAGKPILYYALDFALKFNFKKIIINCHYRHEQVNQAVVAYKERFDVETEIIVLHEPVLLETGGAIKNAYSLFEAGQAIFTLNSDSIIANNQLVWQSMIEQWNPLTMDFLLLLNRIDKSFGSVGSGDFDISSDGSLHCSNELRQFVYTGLQILKPDLIMQNIQDVFSLKEYYTSQRARVYGQEHEGNFYHISNIRDYEKISAIKIS